MMAEPREIRYWAFAVYFAVLGFLTSYLGVYIKAIPVLIMIWSVYYLEKTQKEAKNV